MKKDPSYQKTSEALFEPRPFQESVFHELAKDPGKVNTLYPRRFYGVDMGVKNGDRTSIVEALRGKNGEIYIIDEYSSMPDWKWYRNPIKWWQWRKFWTSVLKSSKNFTVNIDLDKSVKKEEWML